MSQLVNLRSSLQDREMQRISQVFSGYQASRESWLPGNPSKKATAAAVPAPKIEKSKKCELCPRKFGLLTGEHRCKRCFRAVCKSCADQKRIIIGYSIKPKQEHKVCIICAKDSLGQERIRRTHKLQWGKDCDLTQHWIDKLGVYRDVFFGSDPDSQKQLISAGIDFSFQQDLNCPQEVQRTKSYRMMAEMIMRPTFIEDQYLHNYSFVEMLHYVTLNVARKQIVKDVCDVLTAFVSKNANKIGFCEEMVSVAIFLLCFCSPSKAYAIMDALYQQIVPECLWPQNYDESSGEKVFFKQIQQYCELMVKELQTEASLIPRVKRFFELEGQSLLLSLLITSLPFDTNFYLFTQVLDAANKQEALIKALLAVTKANLQSLVLLGPDDALIVSEFIANTSQFAVDKIYSKLKFDIQPVENHVATMFFGFGKQVDTAEDIDSMRIEIQVLKSRNKRLLFSLQKSRLGGVYENARGVTPTPVVEDSHLDKILEELHQKDVLIQELQNHIAQQDFFRNSVAVNPTTSETGGTSLQISNDDISQLQIEIQSLRQELEMSDKLKDIYIKKFSNVQNALENLKRDSLNIAIGNSNSNSPEHNNQLFQSIVMVKQLQPEMEELKHQLATVQDQRDRLEREKKTADATLKEKQKELEIEQKKFAKAQEIIRDSKKKDAEDSQAYQLLMLEQSLIEEQERVKSLQQQVQSARGEIVASVEAKIRDLEQKNRDAERKLQEINRECDELRKQLESASSVNGASNYKGFNSTNGDIFQFMNQAAAGVQQRYEQFASPINQSQVISKTNFNNNVVQQTQTNVHARQNTFERELENQLSAGGNPALKKTIPLNQQQHYSSQASAVQANTFMTPEHSALTKQTQNNQTASPTHLSNQSFNQTDKSSTDDSNSLTAKTTLSFVNETAKVLSFQPYQAVIKNSENSSKFNEGTVAPQQSQQPPPAANNFQTTSASSFQPAANNYSFQPTAPTNNNNYSFQPTAPTNNNNYSFQPTAPTNNNSPSFQPTAPTNNNNPSFQPTAPTNNNNPSFQPTVPTNNNNPSFQPTAPTNNNYSSFQPTPTATSSSSFQPASKPYAVAATNPFTAAAMQKQQQELDEFEKSLLGF